MAGCGSPCPPPAHRAVPGLRVTPHAAVRMAAFVRDHPGWLAAREPRLTKRRSDQMKPMRIATVAVAIIAAAAIAVTAGLHGRFAGGKSAAPADPRPATP